jgi:hypothetical protein
MRREARILKRADGFGRRKVSESIADQGGCSSIKNDNDDDK